MIYFLIPLYMAIASRLAGSPYKYFGLVLYPAPYVLAIYALTYNPVLCAVAYAWVFGWKLTGHADGYRNYVRDNFLSPFVTFIYPNKNSSTYDALFWSIKGGLIASVPAVIIAVFTASYAPALAIFCASFCGYPLAYWLGFHVLNHRFGLVNTAWGELLSGFFAGLGLTFYLIFANIVL